MKTKLLKKTRAYIRRHHPDFQYRIKESQHDIMWNVAVELLEEIAKSQAKIGILGDAYLLLANMPIKEAVRCAHKDARKMYHENKITLGDLINLTKQ